MNTDKLILGMSDKAYHEAPGVSRSYLKKLQQSPAHTRLPDDDTSATGVGSAFHIFNLEGEFAFDEKVIEAPTKTKGVKWDALAAAEPDKCIVPIDGRQLVLEASMAFKEHPSVKEIFACKDLIFEAAAFWDDQETGLKCKVKADIIAPSMSAIIDLKFVASGTAIERKFRWKIRDFGYDLQAPYYTEGIAVATGEIMEHFLFIVVESEAPYFTAVYEMDRDAMGSNTYEIHRLLRLEKKCREAGQWPNWNPEEPGIQTLVEYY